MVKFDCASADDKAKLIVALQKAIAGRKAIWGYTHCDATLTVEVRGFRPVVTDIIRASGAQRSK